jgi:hypothetical protein
MKPQYVFAALVVGFVAVAIMAINQSRSAEAPATVLAQATTPAAGKHAWDCLEVKLSKIGVAMYLQESYNRCEVEIPLAVVLVKFFDKDGNRVGASSFVAYYVAPHERLKHTFQAPVLEFESVGVRAIKEDIAEALR